MQPKYIHTHANRKKYFYIYLYIAEVYIICIGREKILKVQNFESIRQNKEKSGQWLYVNKSNKKS